MSKTFAAVSTLVGTIIGAGILGIPYVIMKSGFLVGLINIIVIATILLIIQLYLGEIGLRTKTDHQLTGYASLYLGEKAKKVMFYTFAFSIYSGLIAYLIGEGESLSYLFFGMPDFALYFGIGFWVVMSGLAYLGLTALKDGEEIGIMFILAMILAIIILFWNKIDVSNLTYNNPALFYIPFGVILFAFMGLTSMPEVERILQKEKGKTRRTILISYAIVFVIYTAFALVVVGSQGSNTPEVATLTLGKPFIILGIFTIFTSYLALNAALINTWILDFKKKKSKAWLYSTVIPLIIYLVLNYFKAASFIKVVTIGGVISGGLMGTLILLMVKNAKLKGSRVPEYSMPYSKILATAIIIILAFGTLLGIWFVF